MGMRYHNCGDWVEHCTVLAEAPQGELCLLGWNDRQSLSAAETRPLRAAA